MRILVVEDEARLAQTLAELLHRQGYTADISGDGLSGLDNAASDIYDLVVLDAMLPGMDGFTLLQRLRQEGHTVPVLMLTARSGVEDRVRGLDSGADYYLTKPFEPQELLACVRLLLRRTDGQPRQGRGDGGTQKRPPLPEQPQDIRIGLGAVLNGIHAVLQRHPHALRRLHMGRHGVAHLMSLFTYRLDHLRRHLQLARHALLLGVQHTAGDHQLHQIHALLPSLL